MSNDHRHSGSTIAVVPVKLLAEAKQRLSPALGTAARRTLVLAMLSDVLAVLRSLDGLSGIVVVTRDPDITRFAQTNGAEAVSEISGADLNAAISCGLDAAARDGARSGHSPRGASAVVRRSQGAPRGAAAGPLGSDRARW